jgi:hypothetical protein
LKNQITIIKWEEKGLNLKTIIGVEKKGLNQEKNKDVSEKKRPNKKRM